MLVQTLLPWKSNKYYIFCVCVCVCVRVRVRVCVCVCVFVAVYIQHAMHMRHIVICGLAGSTVFFTFSHKRHDCRKKKFLKERVCLNFPANSYEKFLIPRRTERDNIISVYWSSCKVPLLLSDFNDT